MLVCETDTSTKQGC